MQWTKERGTNVRLELGFFGRFPSTRCKLGIWGKQSQFHGTEPLPHTKFSLEVEPQDFGKRSLGHQVTLDFALTVSPAEPKELEA